MEPNTGQNENSATQTVKSKGLSELLFDMGNRRTLWQGQDRIVGQTMSLSLQTPTPSCASILDTWCLCEQFSLHFFTWRTGVQLELLKFPPAGEVYGSKELKSHD